MKRREFIKASAAAAFAFQVVPSRVLGGEGQTPPSRKINLAVIGAGGQGGSDLGNMADENIVAICDVDDKRAADSFAKFPHARRYKDFRVMLGFMADKIDAVLVATPDHTHAVAAALCMQLGKHVYCEKPLAHSVSELRALRRIAAEKKVITQVGNQGHSSESIRIFVEWIQAGAIGKVTEIHAGCDAFPDVYCQQPKLAAVRSEKPEVPATLDWDLWQGPAAEREYHPAYVPWNWRGWTRYGGGAIGDWVCHVIDPSFWALDLDMPVAITAEVDGYDLKEHGETFPQGTKLTYEFAAKGDRGPVKLFWYDGKQRIPRPAELDEGTNVVGTGAVVRGTDGVIMHGSHGAGGVRIVPEAKMKAYKRPEARIPRIPRGNHQHDWLNAIREGRQAGSPFEYGGRLSEIGLLGTIAIRHAGKRLEYDEKAMRFTNDEEATKLLTHQYREGWTLG